MFWLCGGKFELLFEYFHFHIVKNCFLFLQCGFFQEIPFKNVTKFFILFFLPDLSSVFFLHEFFNLTQFLGISSFNICRWRCSGTGCRFSMESTPQNDHRDRESSFETQFQTFCFFSTSFLIHLLFCFDVLTQKNVTSRLYKHGVIYDAHFKIIKIPPKMPKKTSKMKRL